MDEKLRADIEAIVKSIFANREEDAQRAALEETLEKSARTIEDLTTELASRGTSLEEVQGELSAYKEEAAAKLATLEASVEAKDVEIAALKDKLTETTAAVETANTEKAALAEELNGIKLDQLADTRMAELAELKVSRQDIDAQKAKVRAMSEEDYSTYKEELVAIRASIVAELESASTASASADEEDNTAAPAQVDSSAAAAAALNVETASTGSKRNDYAELGKALAERVKNSSNRK